jgi:hypothetical protein
MSELSDRVAESASLHNRVAEIEKAEHLPGGPEKLRDSVVANLQEKISVDDAGIAAIKEARSPDSRVRGHHLLRPDLAAMGTAEGFIS